jgi:sugar transferase (PEP-CTERM system associated)
VGLYSRHVVYSGRKVLKRLALAFAFSALAILPVWYVFSLSDAAVFAITPKFYAMVMGTLFGVMAIERFAVQKLAEGVLHLGNVIILGAGDCAGEVIRAARRHHGRAIRIVGILAESRDRIGKTVREVPVIGDLSETEAIVREQQVGTIILCMPYTSPALPVDALVRSRTEGLNVVDACVFYETIAQKLLLERLDPFTLLFPKGFTGKRLQKLAKDAIERSLALVLLSIFALPFALIALAIRLTSPGPVIYRQERVGKGGKVFTLYKFRSMREDAERGTGATWAMKRDPRVTWIGKWLRRTRLDELPQLVNIVKGDMAFVGPRPERPEFVQELRQKIPLYDHRHLVKPGLSGWAQVAFAYAASLEDSREKLRYDLYYVKNLSLFFDLVILLATLRAVVKGQGLA